MALDEVVIEEATVDDLAAVLGLYEAAGIRGEEAFTVAAARRQLETFSRYPYFRLFVARREGRVVGTYELILIDNLAKAGAKTALVEDVAVDPTLQKRGIGRAMMLHARRLAREHGAYKLALSSNQRRPDAHAFYEALGFQRHGVSFVLEP